MDNKNSLFSQIVSYDNLHLAYEKARKGKTLKQYVIDFEEDLKQNLLELFNNHMNICILSEHEKLKYVSWKEFTQKHKFSKNINKYQPKGLP